MVKPFPLKPLRRPGGGLLLMVALGFHGLVLAMPTGNSPTDSEDVVTLQPPGLAIEAPANPTDTIEVVRLPSPSAPLPSQEILSAPVAQTLSRPQSPARPSPAPTPMAAPDSVALPEQQPELRPEPTPAPDTVVEPPNSAPPVPEPAPIPPGLTYNHKTVELSTDTQDFLTWYNEQNWDSLDLPPLPAPKELATLQVPYTGEICLATPPAPGRLEVMVGSDGQLYRPPRLLATTGYDDLDVAALALAAQQTYTEAANPSLPNPTVYWLPMEVMNRGASCSSAQMG
jgi:hypothetical protein